MARPILVHTHGMHEIDFSSMDASQLGLVDAYAARDGVEVMPAVFLARGYVEAFGEVLRSYSAREADLPNIKGFSIEGPLLGRSGGVPPRGIWSPTSAEWRSIAELGAHGLRYVVMAPDGGELDDAIEGGSTYREVIDMFYENGVRIALGHFRHDDPRQSARRTVDFIEHIHSAYGPSPDVLLTDHLFNDMPRNFRHVWRTASERVDRKRDLALFLSTPWHRDNLDTLLGPVPATLVRAAADGKLLPFLNFDGDHVDLQICRRVLEFLGPERLIGITDDTELASLAGEGLHHREGSRLWYRSDGIVAAGTGHYSVQRANLLALGASEADVRQLFELNPRRVAAPLPTPVAAGTGAAVR